MSSNYGGFGATRLPAPSVNAASELDTGHQSMLGLLETAINEELGTAWDRIVNRLPPNHFLRPWVGRKPVGHTCDFEPTEQQRTQFKAQYPLLAVYREGEPELWYPNAYLHQKQQWSVDWILGPITADQIPLVGRFATVVGRVICRTLEYARHPDFRDGVCQFQGEFAHIKPVGVLGPGVQRAAGQDAGAGYYGLTVTVETWEREYDTNSDDPYDINAHYVLPGTADTVEGLAGVDLSITMAVAPNEEE